MKGIEFFRNVSIGRYVDVDSPVHRLTPVAKYLWLMAIIIPVSVSGSSVAVLACSIIALACTVLARVRLGFLLRGFVPVLPLFGIAAVFQAVLSWPGDTSAVLVAIGPVSLSLRELLAIASMALRFVAMMLAIGLFTSVTTEGDTARGVEDLFAPLARLGFPARGFALTIAVAFRFIPIVAGEFESVVKAQAARGADFGSGARGPIRKARAYLPLIVPVTIRALERAEALGEAMEARCYGVGPATRYVRSVGSTADTMARIGAVMFAVAALAGPLILGLH
jgi:energy-coupling factor transport system permease protein